MNLKIPSPISKNFPRQLFFRTLLFQSVLACTIALLLWTAIGFQTQHPAILTIVGLLTVFIVFWSARMQSFPVGRVLAQSQGLLEPTPTPMSDDDLKIDSHGEWGEIEANLNRMRDELVKTRRRLERDRIELATAIGSLSDAILAIDPLGAPLFYNSRFAVLFVHSGKSTPWTLWDVIREPQVLDAYACALKQAIPVATRVLFIDFPSEGRRHFSVSIAPLKRADGSVYGAVGTFHDITELKLAEQMRIDFVANVSHELRTPLTSIKGYADTLRSDLESGKVADPEFIKIISKNVNRLMNLVGDLLDLSALESQSQSLHIDPLSTSEITSRVLNQLSERFRNKEQVIGTAYDEMTVHADAGKIEQVLVNLLDNANKYTPQKGMVKVHWSSDDSDSILTVSDSGPGVSPEHQVRLFERFYRVDKARSREMGGTGLGLAIVKHIMQRHEGSVTVKSGVGQGASFICRFPKKRA